jgi:hypothetical protein
MKKIAIPFAVAFLAALGSWYFLWRDTGEDNDGKGKNGTEQTTPNALTEQDSVPFGDPPSEEELEREQRIKEHARPGEFVEVQFEARKNILGETVAEGTLKNNAELTSYRDLQLMIYFENEEGDPIDSASQVVFEKILPGKKTEFKVKEKGPRKAKNVSIRVHDALVEDPR